MGQRKTFNDQKHLLLIFVGLHNIILPPNKIGGATRELVICYKDLFGRSETKVAIID